MNLTRFTKLYERIILRNTLAGNITLFVLFFIVIFLYYIRLPLSGSLPGDHDTWGNLSMFMDLCSRLTLDFIGHDFRTFLFPYPNPWSSFGLDFFSGIIWVLFYKFGLSEIWAYWFYISTILTLNSLGFMIFSQHFIKQKLISLAISLSFSLQVIVYANIDTPNVLSYFFYFIALHQLFLFFKLRSWKNIIIFSICSGLQLYAAPTVFIFLFFSIATFILIEDKFQLFKYFKFYATSFLIIAISATPYISGYLFHLDGKNSLSFLNVNPLLLNRFLSIQWYDLFKFHPAHFFSKEASNWEQSIGLLKNSFPGFIIFILASASLFLKKSRRFIILFLVLFLVGSGRYLFISEHHFFPNPIDILLYRINFYNIFRVPVRVNMVLLFCLLCLSGIFLDKVFTYFKHGKYIVVAFLTFLILESILWKAKTYNSDVEIASFTKINPYVLSKKDSFNIVLNIPSSLFSPYKDSREFKYMINRFHQQNKTLNGSSAYLPESRIQLWKLLNEKNLNEKTLCDYLQEQKVDGVFVFKDFIEDDIDLNQVNIALNCKCLEVQKTIDNIVLLKFHPIIKKTKIDLNTF